MDMIYNRCIYNPSIPPLPLLHLSHRHMHRILQIIMRPKKLVVIIVRQPLEPVLLVVPRSLAEHVEPEAGGEDIDILVFFGLFAAVDFGLVFLQIR